MSTIDQQDKNGLEGAQSKMPCEAAASILAATIFWTSCLGLKINPYLLNQYEAYF